MIKQIRDKRKLNKMRYQYPTMNERPNCFAVVQNYKGITIKDTRPKRFSIK